MTHRFITAVILAMALTFPLSTVHAQTILCEASFSGAPFGARIDAYVSYWADDTEENFEDEGFDFVSDSGESTVMWQQANQVLRMGFFASDPNIHVVGFKDPNSVNHNEGGESETCKIDLVINGKPAWVKQAAKIAGGTVTGFSFGVAIAAAFKGNLPVAVTGAVTGALGWIASKFGDDPEDCANGIAQPDLSYAQALQPDPSLTGIDKLTATINMNVAGVVALGKAAITSQNRANCFTRPEAGKQRQFTAAQHYTNLMGNRLFTLANLYTKLGQYMDRQGITDNIVSTGELNDEMTSFTIGFPGDGSDTRSGLALVGLTSDDIEEYRLMTVVKSPFDINGNPVYPDALADNRSVFISGMNDWGNSLVSGATD